MAAESVSAPSNINRSCEIEIKNMSNVYDLKIPQNYMYRGFCSHPPQSTIKPNMTGDCRFIRNPDIPCGAVGVLTYDLYHSEVCTERIAILFSVPYSYEIHENIFGVGVFESTRPCGYDLYNYMYNAEEFTYFTRGKAKDGRAITYTGKTVELHATMSNVGEAFIRVEIHDK